MKLNTIFTSGALAFGITVLAGSVTAETIKVGIAAEPYPPFASLNSAGEWEGWEIEMIGAICTAAELDCEITPVSWDGIIPSLTGQQIDAIMASMSITEERMQVIDFSDKYYNTPAVIMADSSLDIEPTAEGLAGKILGVQASTIHQTYAQAHFPDTELRIYQTQDEANQDLFSGRIDATQADSIALDAFLSESGGSCCTIIGAVAPDDEILGLGAGVGLRQGEDELKAAFNAGIAKVLEDGTYEEITARYFASSIY
ncbi:transporter substrate-binding domain-containing protein [Yoonia sp. I 8.24]|uniref:transporter substrate-binding domain-containing protein n=1 Tax=Yoonia sp. I 8.24 TaxID=1537229 RepID=UPI001EDED1F3|nr:transporter substrate-binding domain-containing protein [Yoonia sp. I 8.24]MCG3268350.1 transporter substrate-binding domain-containing protein [Yoonia sp. I 8.24]